ncbi:hypothetical protein M2103_000315 [Ereboglobus sp. PH5-5]|uniref:hypothetical protein n=1 Tax=Ereboglobus sp. PH5-5 TaxID=2940529 RepID=UPI00240533DC|nr:hypothetical protein [Ereboglobus sp. PH5-5]MDF9832107.1 hypothetical protein [Ereboglobus sp. PH5-5]
MKAEIHARLRAHNIKIPDDPDEAANLYLGALLIEKFDYWLARGFDYTDNPQPPTPFARPSSEAAKKDATYRTAFAKLDSDTKRTIKELLRESLEGILFSTLLTFDQTPAGKWKLQFRTKDMTARANPGRDYELHDDLYKWMDLFSKNKQ